MSDDEKELDAGSMVDLDDVERLLAAEADEDDEGEGAAKPKAPTDLYSIRFGDDVDEDLRGKTAADLAHEARALREALRISEDARKSQSPSRQPEAPQAPPRDPDLEMTDEDIVKLMQEDGVRALRVLRKQMSTELGRHHDERMRPLTEGSADTALAEAMRQFPDEFEALKEEISQFASRLPKADLASVSSWRNVIAYIRGLPGNYEKLNDHKQRKAKPAAQDRERRAAGYSGRPGSSGDPGASGGGDYGLDDIEKEIAVKMAKPGVPREQALRDYAKWKKMG